MRNEESANRRFEFEKRCQLFVGMHNKALSAARWREVDLASRPKGHHVKVKIAQQLRRQNADEPSMDCRSAKNWECQLGLKFTPVSIVSSDPYLPTGTCSASAYATSL